MPHYAFIALGANLGDSKAKIADALKRLSAHFKIEKTSSLYKTSAVGGPEGQPDFINAAAKIIPSGEPADTIRTLLNIEKEMGRLRVEHWGPRIIDLDLIDQDGRIIEEPEMTIPHPRMHERAFVLYPLKEIAPDWRHPISGLSVIDLILALPREARDVIISREKL